jgi:allene oxide cyclase
MTTKPLRPIVIYAVLAFVLAVGLFVVNCSIFISRATAANGPTKLHFIEHSTNDKVIDIGPAGDSLGDLDVFANPVYNAANKRQVGHDGGSCVRTVVGKAYECNWTVFLEKGQVSVEGPYYDNADSVLTVTGGTALYSGARGEMNLHARGKPVGSEYDFVFYLI